MARAYLEYEKAFPRTFPWKRGKGEDVPRFVLGEDGWWFNPQAAASGKALISCVGDLMCEPPQCRKSRFGDTFFFHPAFRFVRGIFKNSDFAVGNLETTVTDKTPYTGEYHVIGKSYHCNAPVEYLDALRYAGFDALTNANNHDLDSALEGLEDTIRHMEERGFPHTGTFTPGDRQRYLLININGIRLALLSYATRFNRLDQNLTEEAKALFLNEFSKEKAEKDIADARRQGAEFVLSYIHWGKEHIQEPVEEQLQIAQELADAGTDYILGSHSHCLMHHSEVTARDGRTVPVCYSMGNFVTGAREDLCKHTGILQLELQKTECGISQKSWFIPCHVQTQLGTSAYCVVPTDPGHSSGSSPFLRENEAYIRKYLQDEVTYLPSGSLTLREACALWGTEVPQGMEETPVTKLCTDALCAVQGSIFFTKHAPDRVSFIQSRSREVALMVSEEDVEDYPYIKVPDVDEAYKAVCRTVMGRFSAKALLVAGESGKTLTKALCHSMLRQKHSVLTPADAAHRDTGLWQNLHPHHDWYLQEVRDTDTVKQGILAELCILTGDCRFIPEAKCYLTPCGVKAPENAVCRSYGFDGSAFYKGEGLRFTEDGLFFDMVWSEGRISLSAKLHTKLQAECLLAAAAAMAELGMTEGDICRGAADFENDDYSHSLLSLEDVTLVTSLRCKNLAAAADAMDCALRQKGRKLAFLGTLGDGEDPTALAAEKGFTVLPDCDPAALSALLQKGDVLLLVGGEEQDFHGLVRKCFGLCDGFLADAR